jgi:rRNA maturation endonuclease Nob1
MITDRVYYYVKECYFCKGKGSLFINMRFTVCSVCGGSGIVKAETPPNNEGTRV